MHNGISWTQMLQQMYAQLSWQTQRLEKLEQTAAKLQAELDLLKQQKQIHIERIEYSFDQLKVERLEGTLSIGVTPGTFEDMEDFTVNGAVAGQKSASSAPGHPMPMSPPVTGDLNQQISSGIQEYLNRDADNDMRKLEEKYQYPLDSDYKKIILDDIRNQVKERIRYYVNRYQSMHPDQPLEAIRQTVLDKTKADIRSALEAYISHLPGKEGGTL